MPITIRTSSIFVGIALAVVFGVSAMTALAVAPADFGLFEGDVVSAHTTVNDPDVYIVNEHGYKRLFVNPEIFNLYGHLGFNKVKSVTAATRDAFPTSGLFRNCESNDQRVYGLDVIDEDVANLRWVNTTGEQAVVDDPNFFKKVFCINNREQALYGAGANYQSVRDVPDYSRFGKVPLPPVQEEDEVPEDDSPPVVADPDGPASVVVRTADSDQGARIIEISDSEDVDGVELYRFVIEETAGIGIWIEGMTVEFIADGVDEDDLMRRARILDEVRQYGSDRVMKRDGVIEFGLVSLHLDGFGEQELFIEADFRGNNGGFRYPEGQTLQIKVTPMSIFDENGNRNGALLMTNDATSDVLELRSASTIGE